ncbi:MAG: regulatory protein TetR [Oscillospiraceae bacterium]|jgi:AcrR family transcriptional regulator|nr:regulatory protein TetR [Oscillospiraceae bacterium]
MKKTTRQLQKEQTKDLLVKTAYELFSKRGILNTRMADIAQSAGVSHGTVFLHFDTQETLVTQVITSYCGKIAERTHELANSGGTIREMLSAHLEGIIEFEPFYTRMVIENRLLPANARDAWIHLQSAISFHFSQAIEREPQSNKMDIPLSLLFNMWMGLVHYYLANGDLFSPNGNVIRRYKQTLIENYLKMIEKNHE